MKRFALFLLLLVAWSPYLWSQPIIWPGDWLYENFYGATNAADARARLEISSTNYVAETPFDAETIFTNASGQLTLATNITGANGVLSNYAQIWGTEIYAMDTFYGPTVYSSTANTTNLNINGGGDIAGSNGSITNFAEVFATELHALDTLYAPTVDANNVGATNITVQGGTVDGNNGVITNFAEMWATELHTLDTAYAPTVIATSVGATNFTMWEGTFDAGTGNITNAANVSADVIWLGGTNITTMLGGGGGGSGDMLADGTVPFTGTPVVSNTTPTLSLLDTTAGEDDYTIYADADDFYIYSSTMGAVLSYDAATGTWDMGTNALSAGSTSFDSVTFGQVLYAVTEVAPTTGTNYVADCSYVETDVALTNNFHLTGLTNIPAVDLVSGYYTFWLTSTGNTNRQVSWEPTPTGLTVISTGGITNYTHFATNCVLGLRYSIKSGSYTNLWIVRLQSDGGV